MNPVKAVTTIEPGRRALSLLDEFREFAFKGNVVELAIGVIIGGAFGKIVDSLVKQIIMPLVSVIAPGEQSYLQWKWTIRGVAVPYGQFLGEVVNFLIVATAVFLFLVKFLGLLKTLRAEDVATKNEVVAEPVPPSPTREQELLTEIRDLLKQQRS